MAEMVDRAVDAIKDIEIIGMSHECVVRKIIDALRDPSPTAARAGAIALTWDRLILFVRPADAKSVWQAMLDAA